MTAENRHSGGSYREAIASIVFAAALCAGPAGPCASQGGERPPVPDVTRPKIIRTHRLRIPTEFFKQDTVRFERARIETSGSIFADGHKLSLQKRNFGGVKRAPRGNSMGQMGQRVRHG